MSLPYDFTLTDGTSLGTVLPLEGNGVNAQSVPRQIVDIRFDASTPTFVLQGDITARFLSNFPFAITGNTAYDGNYTVGPTDSTLDSNGNTVIPTATSDVSFGFDLIALTEGVSGTFTFTGSNNGSCIFFPSATFNLINNSFAPANKSYVVASSVTSNQYSVTGVTVGANGSWTISGLYGNFFVPGQRFKLVGAQQTVNGIYTIASVTQSSTNTTIHPVEAVPSQATISGIIILASATTIVTVNGSVPATTQPNGQIQSPITQQHAFIAPPAITLTTPGEYLVSWRIAGDLTGQILPGCSIVIKNNDFFSYQTLTVLSTSVTNNITSVVTEVMSTGNTSPVISQIGNLLFPAPSVPYGNISYNTPNPLSCLQLIGRGSPSFNPSTSWGNAFQNNQIHQLENFANATAPNNPLVGQLWWNTTGELYVHDTPVTWKGIIVSGIPSTGIVDMNNNKIINLADATNATDAMNMETSDTLYIAKTGGNAAGRNGIMTGDLTMNPGNIKLKQNSSISVDGTGNINVATGAITVGDVTTSVQLTPTAITITAPSAGIPAINAGQTRIVNLSTPQQPADAANKAYVDGLVNGIIWLQPIADSNLFDDSLSGPTTGSSADPADPLGGYHRSFIVKPNIFTITSRTAGVNGTFTISSNASNIVNNDLVEIPGDSATYTIVGVSTGNLGNWVIAGNNATKFTAGMTFIVSGNSNSASNTVYSVSSAVNNGANTVVNVTGNVPAMSGNSGTITVNSYVISNVVVSGATTVLTVNGTVPATGGAQLLHANGAWNGKDGHIVGYNGITWVSLLGRAIRPGDRVGIFLEPDDADPLVVLPGGSFVGKAGKILTVNTIDSLYNVTWSGTVPEYTPREPDAISVLGTYSPHFGFSYTFRGAWGTGVYRTDYTWIQFAGPAIVGDGAGLEYTGSVLNVGQGTGIIVNPHTVQLDGTYVDSLYMRRDGTLPATGNINIGNHRVINVSNPTAAQDAVTLSFADGRYIQTANTGAYVSSFNSRAGAVTLSATDVNNALGGTPVLQNGNAALASILGTSNLTMNSTGGGSATINVSSGSGGTLFGNGAGGVVGSVDSAGNASFANVTGTSDVRYKQSFVPIDNALIKLNNVETFTFEFKNNIGVRLAGISAQSLQAQLPEAITADATGKLAVSVQGSIALLVAAVQELSKEVETLKAQLQN